MKKIAIIILLFSATILYSQADYGRYVQPVNLELINNVLSSKQNSYDRNITLVSNHMEKLKTNLFNYFSYDKNKRSDAMERWNGTIQNTWALNPNFSSNSQTQTIISNLNTLYYEYIDDIE